jgi:hypothetical protein
LSPIQECRFCGVAGQRQRQAIDFKAYFFVTTVACRRLATDKHLLAPLAHPKRLVTFETGVKLLI